MSTLLKRLLLVTPLMFSALFGLAACAPTTTATPAAASTVAPTTAATVSPTASPAVASAPTPTAIEQSVLKVSSNAKLGNILTDAQGLTLYTYQKDTPDTSNCADTCAKNWPALTVPQGVTPTAAKGIPGNIGVLERVDKTYQVTYNDMPLYHYVGDKQPGDTNGNGLLNQWSVVVIPPATPASATPAASATDWMTHGFSTILASQNIAPGSATTITAGPYTIFVPADAFAAPVKFIVLSGDPASFRAKAAQGQTPILAFAFNVRNARTNALIAKFAEPVMLTARDSKIAGDSGYYNIDANGDYALNSSGLQVQAGELTHPIAGASVGWVITAPVNK